MEMFPDEFVPTHQLVHNNLAFDVQCELNQDNNHGFRAHATVDFINFMKSIGDLTGEVLLKQYATETRFDIIGCGDDVICSEGFYCFNIFYLIKPNKITNDNKPYT